jgi:uncharacterized protein (TIGR02246 family)
MPNEADDTSAAAAMPLVQAVDRLRRQHVAAVNDGDVVSASSIFAPDGVLLPPGMPALDGVDAIRGWFTGLFANVSVRGFGLQTARVETHGDSLVEHGTWQATFQPADGSTAKQGGGSYLTVYARVADGSVRVIRDSFTGLPA